MDLLDRYLQAVKFWLPRLQKQDIIDELSEDIQSQVEEKEVELGRRLTEDELATILKQVGAPIKVANRYAPHRYLIGPMLYPTYRFVVKIVALGYLVPWVLVWVAMMSFSPTYRAEHGGGNWLAAIAALWAPLWLTAFSLLGSITIVFALLERSKYKFLENWDPRKLPAVRDPHKIPRASSIAEIVANLVVCLWWIQLRSPIVFGQSVVRITLAPVWRYFFWSFLGLTLATVALSAFNLLRPYWTVPRAVLRAALEVTGVGLLAWLCKAQVLVSIVVRDVDPEKTARIANAVNFWIARSFWITILIGLLSAASGIYRIVRVMSKDNPARGGISPAHTTSALI